MTAELPSGEIKLVTGEQAHRLVIQRGLMEAEKYVWIATANLKDMHVPMARGYRPVLEVMDQLAARGVAFRVVHADLPSRRFRATLERFERLTGGGLELQICPRSHWKLVAVDGRLAWFGSANFTGAGLGAKSEGRRNFEIGAYSEDPKIVRAIEAMFDGFWIGEHCGACGLRSICPDPIDASA